MYRWRARENKDLLPVYGGDGEDGLFGDADCSSEEFELDSESSGEEGRRDRGVRNSLSMEIHGLQREQRVFFSNQEYYRRLEELKSSHLRNMAELERMYISQASAAAATAQEGDRGRPGRGRDSPSFSGPTRRLQKINSQEELDFNETSSGSDRSDVSGEDVAVAEMMARTLRRSFGRCGPPGPDGVGPLRFLSESSKPRGGRSGPAGVRVGSAREVTVPRPFKMMLREEDRKRRKVRTRSQIELENSLLRRELEELRECRKKFRASPAPAHIHLPLYEMIGRRSGRTGGSPRPRYRDASPKPFRFLERERRKREAKMAAELAAPGEERRGFKARPVPAAGRKPDAKASVRGDARPTEPPKKQIQLSIEMVKERERPDSLDGAGGGGAEMQDVGEH